jgi:hypothetical protein
MVFIKIKLENCFCLRFYWKNITIKLNYCKCIYLKKNNNLIFTWAWATLGLRGIN